MARTRPLDDMSQGSQRTWWDTEIAPYGAWWKLDLRGLWRYRDLTMLLTHRDLTAQYKQSVLGPAWLVLQPLLITLTYTVMFGLVARIAPDGMPPLLFYITGIVPWTCFANVLNRTSRTLTGNANLFSKVYFPRLVMPLSTTFTALFTFGVQCILMFLIIGAYALSGAFHWTPGLSLLGFPAVVLVMSVLGLGAGILISALTTKYRDLSFLVAFGTQLLMFASPVIVPLEMAKGSPMLYTILRANPMTPVIECTRAMVFGTEVPWLALAYSGGFSVVLLVIALMVFQRVERSFTDVI